MYQIYGIPNCDTVKKALTHLRKQQLDFEFISFKKDKPTNTLIKSWKNFFNDWPVNKRGPTYRKIKDEFELANSDQKFLLLIENTSAIKRPILTYDSQVICIGYDVELYDKLK
jgi:arsenate reductase (glutaredoxin)